MTGLVESRDTAVRKHVLRADTATGGVTRCDIRPGRDPEHVARLLTSTYLGIRTTCGLDDPRRFFDDFEAQLLLTLPRFANPERLTFYSGSIRRRSALAIENAAPSVADKL